MSKNTQLASFPNSIYRDSNGNIGIGIVPSSWAGGTESALQVKHSSIYSYGGYEMGMQVNAYYNAGWKYIGSNTSTQIQLSDGNIIFKNAGAGTAGNAISYSEIMRITSTGKVGIGTSNPSNTYQGLTIYGTDPSLSLQTSIGSGWTWTQYVNSAGTTNFSMGVNQTQPQFVIKAGAGLDNPNFVLSSSGNVGIGGAPNERLSVYGPSGLQGFIRWSDSVSGSAFLGWASGGVPFIHSNNNVLAFGANGSNNFGETMRLSSGNVGIGTSSPIAYANYIGLTINGTNGSMLHFNLNGTNIGRFGANSSEQYMLTAGATPLTFYTNVTERMRITNGGAVCIGTSSPASNSSGIFLGGAGSSYFNVYQNYSGNSVGLEMTDNANTLKIQFFGSSGNYYFAGSNLSDRRLKSNIIEMTEGLSKIIQLKPSTFTYDKNPDILKGGFIAQEVSEAIPEFVTIPEDDKEMMGVDYFGILALAVKAIQEQQIQIEDLKSKIK